MTARRIVRMKAIVTLTPRKRSRLALAGLLACVGGGAGCGNYSNEDLDFVSAIPQTADLSVEAPRQSAVRPGLEDDALQTTTDVTGKLNAIAADLLALVDKIRASYPTSRNGSERIWGPAPADNNPGWQFEFTMTKTAGIADASPSFEYALVMIPPLAAPDAGLSLLTGQFVATGEAGTGTGMGYVALTPVAARAAGAVLPGLEKLMTLRIDYNAGGWPRTLTVLAANLPTIDPTVDALNSKYTYTRNENGDGSMGFTFLKDAIPGPAGVDTLNIASHWLGTGPGRSDIAVTAGDGAGLINWTDCWDASSQTSYNSRTGMGDQNACIPLM